MKDEKTALMRCSMEVYAAMVDRVDQSIGRLLTKLQAAEKTPKHSHLVRFGQWRLRGNNSCETDGEYRRNDRQDGELRHGLQRLGNGAEHSTTFLKELQPRRAASAPPLIVSWPGNISRSGANHYASAWTLHSTSSQRIVDVAQVRRSRTSFRAAKRLCFCKESACDPRSSTSNVKTRAAIVLALDERRRDSQWELEGGFLGGELALYDLDNDRNEQHNLARKHPKRLQTLEAQWQAWSDAQPEFEGIPSQPYLEP